MVSLANRGAGVLRAIILIAAESEVVVNTFNYYSGECTCGYISGRKSELHTCPACGADAETEPAPRPIPQGRAMFVPTERLKPPPRALIPKREPELDEAYDALDAIGITINDGLPNIAGRPSFAEVHMQLAVIIAKRSTCSRRKIGCVIVSSDFRRVLSSGYNGNAAGLPNCCDEPEVSGACGCLHAEENAAISCSEPAITPKTVFTTTYPCKMCAKRLIQLGGVEKVCYMEDYHDELAADIFENAGIRTERIVFESADEKGNNEAD